MNQAAHSIHDARTDLAGRSRAASGRLIVVSNRVKSTSGEQAGGLAQALSTALKRNDSVWIGWSGKNSPSMHTNDQSEGHVRCITFDLPLKDFKRYYIDYANRALWPLLHSRTDLMTFSAEALRGYLKINESFAEIVSREARDNDVVWVHDYHLIPLASMLRARGTKCRIGFFLHVPVPAPRTLMTLPQHRALFGLLGAYDLVGVQTAADARALRSYLVTEAHAEEKPDGVLELPRTGALVVRDYPIGIDPDEMSALAAKSEEFSETRELKDSLGSRSLILGVDRLDYSKGLPHRLRAFGLLLSNRPDLKGRATFLQVAPESRRDVREYRSLSRQVQRLIGDINGHHAEPNWTPVRYVNKSYPHAVLAGFYRLARVAAVTPLRDGMNLVAKEYLACQAEHNPGVLVLSEFAGAAQQLSQSALIVNPYDAESCARAFAQALTMPLHQRRRRWVDAMSNISSHDVHGWCADFLAGLNAIATQSGDRTPAWATRAAERRSEPRV